MGLHVFKLPGRKLLRTCAHANGNGILWLISVPLHFLSSIILFSYYSFWSCYNGSKYFQNIRKGSSLDLLLMSPGSPLDLPSISPDFFTKCTFYSTEDKLVSEHCRSRSINQSYLTYKFVLVASTYFLRQNKFESTTCWRISHPHATLMWYRTNTLPY